VTVVPAPCACVRSAAQPCISSLTHTVRCSLHYSCDGSTSVATSSISATQWCEHAHTPYHAPHTNGMASQPAHLFVPALAQGGIGQAP
jgi:hypothetical protein